MKKTLVGVGAFVLVVGIVVLVFTFIDVPHTVTEPYQAPESSAILDESFTVPPDTVQRTRTLTKDDVVHIELQVTAGGNKDVDFYVNDGTADLVADTRVTTVDMNWTVPSNGTYYFIFDNSFSWITSKDVTAKLTRFWTETEYRDVTKYYPWFSYEFAYVGLVLCIVGIGVLIFGSLKNS